ncbi:Cro/CI family transcriptional regulator [Azotobacter beijerinckii]|uniref:Cro protein n=1 Tax=Azotobacter beijerinckii TaxID=170623 RepID=A0A1I4HAD9_9GAMM|nr:Cro/CI family transcriptional regulator [Azotobacter beijerinckii]SFB60223.1 Cro protein [Azotobacter beijerinckii]SFL38391.1 Cro protein [Azotobacter beijerinckii]
MRRIHISEFVAELGQAGSAKALGLTQGGLNKALRLGREIYVTRKPDGTYEAHELRPFPSQRKRSAA